MVLKSYTLRFPLECFLCVCEIHGFFFFLQLLVVLLWYRAWPSQEVSLKHGIQKVKVQLVATGTFILTGGNWTVIHLKKNSTAVTNNKVHTLYTCWTEPIINGLLIWLCGWGCLLNFAPHKDKFGKKFLLPRLHYELGKLLQMVCIQLFERSKQMLFTSAGLTVQRLDS